MNARHVIAAAMLAAFGWSGVQAAPVTYEGTLTAGAPVTGSVGGFSWFLEQGAGVDFWRFSGNAGSQVTLQGLRLNANLDLALSLYAGTTTADTSLFRATSSWSGLTFLASADDEIARPSRNGDPLLANFTLPSTGTFTVAIGGALSSDAGQYPYQLTLNPAAAAPVPAPATAWLVLLGLAGGIGLRRRASAFASRAALMQ